MDIHEINPVQLSEAIRQWEKHKDKTLTDLVSVCGINYIRIQMLECGQKNPLEIVTEAELAKLIKILQN